MATPKNKDTPKIAPEEYLKRERASIEKHEYIDGEIFAMVGASRSHMRIAMNIASLLREQLKKAPCRPYGSDLKIVAGRSGKAFFYPDFSIVCGKHQYFDDTNEILSNPRVIVEILSPSTEAYDRGNKFFWYQHIEGFSDYILVSQDEPLIEIRSRHEGKQWILEIIEGLDSSLVIPSISCTLPLSEVYDRVWEE